jgi:hypothetical protein
MQEEVTIEAIEAQTNQRCETITAEINQASVEMAGDLTEVLTGSICEIFKLKIEILKLVDENAKLKAQIAAGEVAPNE